MQQETNHPPPHLLLSSHSPNRSPPHGSQAPTQTADTIHINVSVGQGQLPHPIPSHHHHTPVPKPNHICNKCVQAGCQQQPQCHCLAPCICVCAPGPTPLHLHCCLM